MDDVFERMVKQVIFGWWLSTSCLWMNKCLSGWMNGQLLAWMFGWWVMDCMNRIFRLYEQIYMNELLWVVAGLWATSIFAWMAQVSCMLVTEFMGLYTQNCSRWEVTATMFNVFFFIFFGVLGHVIFHLWGKKII